MNRYIAFCKVVEAGSFSQAADLLGYTQPGVSQMIQSLEDELSTRLLVRSRVGVKLTPEGQELLPYITTIVNGYRAMTEKNAEIKGLHSGLIRIGTYTSVSSTWLPRMIKGFQKIYPQVQFSLMQGEDEPIVEWVRTGEVDFGLHNIVLTKGLRTVSLYTDEMLAVLSPHHPLATKKTVTLQDLSAEPNLLLGGGGEPLGAFLAQNIKPHIKNIIHDYYTVLTMVEEGYGISIIPEPIMRKKRYDVISVPIDPPIKREMGIVFKNMKTMPIASRYFINYIREQLYARESNALSSSTASTAPML